MRRLFERHIEMKEKNLLEIKHFNFKITEPFFEVVHEFSDLE
jgi:hypothetical protein